MWGFTVNWHLTLISQSSKTFVIRCTQPKSNIINSLHTYQPYTSAQTVARSKTFKWWHYIYVTRKVLWHKNAKDIICDVSEIMMRLVLQTQASTREQQRHKKEVKGMEKQTFGREMEINSRYIANPSEMSRTFSIYTTNTTCEAAKSTIPLLHWVFSLTPSLSLSLCLSFTFSVLPSEKF